MSKDYSSIPIDKMRRKDREKGEEFIKTLLHQAPFCTIANVYKDLPYAHANTFFYDEEKHVIYFHSAKEGRFIFNIADSSKACLSISEMGRLLPADEAMEFSVEYKGVVVFGNISVIENDEAEEALQKLLDKYFPHLKPGKDYKETTAADLERTAVYKMTIEKWTGKEKKVAEDFLGAFYYGTNK